MMSSDFDSRHLVFKQAIFEITGNVEFLQPSACFLREVIGHLEIDVVRRNSLLTSPAFIDDVGQFL
jgi:hypothetical protein